MDTVKSNQLYIICKTCAKKYKVEHLYDSANKRLNPNQDNICDLCKKPNGGAITTIVPHMNKEKFDEEINQVLHDMEHVEQFQEQLERFFVNYIVHNLGLPKYYANEYSFEKIDTKNQWFVFKKTDEDSSGDWEIEMPFQYIQDPIHRINLIIQKEKEYEQEEINKKKREEDEKYQLYLKLKQQFEPGTQS